MTAQLREATQADVAAMVEVHLRAFPGFFLTQLGRPFLRRLYAGFIRESGGRALVALRDGGVIGFIAGAARPERFFRERLCREGLAFALNALPGLARSPGRTARRLWAALRYRGERPPELQDSWLISSVAVDPSARATGVGSALVSAYCGRAAAAHAHAVYLLTDESDNEAQHAFYERNDFRLHSRVTRSGRRVMRLYVRATS